MKINENTKIAVSGRINSREIVEHLQGGSRINARVLERLSGTRAVIEINGHQMQAEFVKGVPVEKNFSLILENKNGDTLFFRLAGDDKKIAYLSKLAEFTVYNIEDLIKMNLSKLGHQLKNGLTGIFEFNKLLLFIKNGQKERRSKIPDILKKMQALNVKSENLIFFSFLFSGLRGNNLLYLLPLLSVLCGKNPRRGEEDYLKLQDEEAASRMVQDFIEDLENGLKEEKSDISILRDLLEELQPEAIAAIKDARIGILPYFDNEFRLLHYLVRANTFLVSIELSIMGRIEVLVRDMGQVLSVMIFCENETIKDALNMRLKELKDDVNSASKKSAQIFVYVTKNIVENIIEINFPFISNSVLDVKV